KILPSSIQHAAIFLHHTIGPTHCMEHGCKGTNIAFLFRNVETIKMQVTIHLRVCPRVPLAYCPCSKSRRKK
ncbi:hypothetical protein L9F63_005091, partial [Diploptera punctata]